MDGRVDRVGDLSEGRDGSTALFIRLGFKPQAHSENPLKRVKESILQVF
jgi:hypothetical protein